MVREFLERKRLAKLGVTFPVKNLCSFKSDCFLIIDAQIERLRERDREKQTK